MLHIYNDSALRQQQLDDDSLAALSWTTPALLSAAAADMPFAITQCTNTATASAMPGCVWSLADVSITPIKPGASEQWSKTAKVENTEVKVSQRALAVAPGPLNDRVARWDASVRRGIAFVLHDQYRQLGQILVQTCFPVQYLGEGTR